MRCEKTLQQRRMEGIAREFIRVTDEITGGCLLVFIGKVISDVLKPLGSLFTLTLCSTLRWALEPDPTLFRFRGIREPTKF